MNENIEKVLAILDGFRMSDEITYSAYSALHDEISLLDDLLKEQQPITPKLSYSTCRCGKCENIVGLYLEGHFQYKDSFCGKCGREVNWREMRFDE